MSQQRIDNSWLTAPARRPVATWIVTAVVVCISVFGITRLELSGSLQAMFPQRHPAAQAMARLSQEFHAADSLLLLVTSEMPDSKGRMLAFAERFERRLASDETGRRLTTQVIYRLPDDFRRLAEEVVAPSLVYYLDEDGFAELQRRLTPEAMVESLQHLEAVLASPGAGGAAGKLLAQDPLQLHQLVMGRIAPGGDAWRDMTAEEGRFSKDGRSLLVQVRGRGSVSDMDYVVELMECVRNAVKGAEPGGLRVEYSGAYAIAETAQRQIRSDMIVSVTGAVLMLQVLFWLTYSGWLTFPMAFAPVVVGIAAAFGAMSLVNPALSPPTAVIGAILAGLAIDYGIHFLSHYHGLHGGAAVDRCGVVLRCLGPAMFAALVTSVIAFASIASSEIPAMRSFATLGVFGLAFSLLATVTLLPAMLRLTHRPGSQGPHLRWNVVGFTRWGQRHAMTCIVLTGLVFVAAGGVILARADGHRWIESDIHVMHPQPNAPLETQRKITKEFGQAADPLFVYLRADTQGQLVDLAHEVRRRLGRDSLHDRVAGSFGLANLLPDPSVVQRRDQAVRAFDADGIADDFRRALADSPFDPERFEAYARFLGEMLRPPTAPMPADLRPYETAWTILPRDAQSAEAVTLVFPAGPLEDRATRHETLTALNAALADVRGAILTGMSVVAHDAETSIHRELLGLLWAASVFVFVWLVIYFRKLSDVGLALGPVVFAAVILWAWMSLTGMRLNMINLVAIPLLVGLGIDYGIFFVSTARRIKPEAPGGGETISAFASSGHAVILTSLTTLLGFGSLAFTSVPAIRSLGILMAVGIVSCLWATLMGLGPWLLRDRRGARP